MRRWRGLSDLFRPVHEPATIAQDLPAPPIQALAAMPLFARAPVGILFTDLTGRIADANPAAARVLPAPTGQRLAELVVCEDRSAVEQAIIALARIEEAARPHAFEVDIAGPIRRSVSLHLDRLDNTTLLIHVVDVTAFKELEGQVVQAQKMQAVGQLAGGVAHDFNNLLTAMIGFCDLLLLRHKPGDASFADIMHIKQNANRAASLVRQLLAFSRQQKLTPKVIDITETLAELSHLLRRLIGQQVTLKLIHGRDLGLVRVDQSQFEQVIINLAVNARDAMPGGGVLTMRTRNEICTDVRPVAHETMPPGAYILIEVSDTGSGIPSEVLDRIFEPFFTTKPVGMGTGLGLSTVYGIVRQTGGFIDVDSTPGAGTCFRIWLPQHAGSAAHRPVIEQDRDGEAATGQGTILLVEDEDPVRLFTARALRGRGYKVIEAKSGDAALELLQGMAEPLDLLLTDAVMPGIDGPALIALVRDQRPDLKVICISGHTDESLRQRLDAMGDVLFLAKPFSLKQLAQRVADVLRTSA